MENPLEEDLKLLVERPTEARGAVMLETLKRLDAALASGRGSLPEDVVHYLERRSYAKALAALRQSRI